ncbi:MAG: hypothetical protein Q9218_007490 [Villophora microphyllina]
MDALLRLFYTILLLALPPPTYQVDIVLEWWLESNVIFDNQASFRCDDIKPGVCCKPHPELLASSIKNRRAGGTSFIHLQQNQFGAGWAARRNLPNNDYIAECSGAPILRVHGPSDRDEDRIEIYNPPWGDFEAENTPENIVFAASWVDLRLKLPPSGAATRYLQWQGVQGLVWGKDTWSAASDGIPFPKVKPRADVLNGRALHGVANISTPRRWVYPSRYTVNKTEFVNMGTGIYISGDGRVLNLKNL